MNIETPGSERIGAVNSGVESVNGGIASAAQSQGIASIENALKSFAWADSKESEEAAGLNDPSVNIQLAGYTDQPADYLARASGGSSASGGFSAIAAADRILGNLRNQDFNFNEGVSNFSECGLREALFSKENLIVALGGRMPPQKDVPAEEFLSKSQNIDDILRSPELKNPDNGELHAALFKLFQMFSTVDGVVRANMDVRLNILKGLRA
jgi:hypothetical protein